MIRKKFNSPRVSSYICTPLLYSLLSCFPSTMILFFIFRWADQAGKDYKFKFHYKNKLSRDCVSLYNVTVAEDSSITCELKKRITERSESVYGKQ